jgi:hypothetical protein
MPKNYIEELRGLIEKYKDKGFEYGKPIDYLEFRNSITLAEMEKEILNLENLEFAEKQFIEEDIRYALYYLYSRSRGRVYVIKFTNKIRIITVYPLGRATLKGYQRGKFKK